MEMAPPVQTLTQEILYEGNLKRIREMTLKANTDLLDITADHESDIDATELENFKTALQDIERGTSTV